MKAPPRDDGVSSVLGAILVFGLLVVTLTTVQTQFVPVWQEQREARHMQGAHDQFVLLKADADRMVGNRTQAALTDSISLGTPTGFGFFQRPSPAGEVAFAPSGTGGTGLILASPRLRVFQDEGQQTFSQGESWLEVTGGNTLPFVTDMLHLRLNITTPPTPVPQSTVGEVVFRVTDSQGTEVGRFLVEHHATQDDYIIDLATYGQASATVPVTTERWIWDRQNPPDHVYVNLLQQDFFFRDVLRTATPPFTITITRNGMTADYTAVYRIETPGGGSGVAGAGGLVLPDYSIEADSGSLRLRKDNNEFPSQTLILEHGAVLLQQGDTASVLVPPHLNVAAAGTQLSFEIDIPALRGDATTVGGADTASVRLAPGTRLADYTASAATFTLTFPTAHPAAWADLFARTMAAAAIPASQYAVTTAATSATLTLNGPSALASVDDLVVTVRVAGVSTELRPSG